MTILAWSFVRDDQPLAVTADQVALALREEVPAGIIIHTLILVDGQPVQNVQLDAGDTATVAVNAVVTGARTATFQSKVVSGTCGPSERSYAVLGDGYVG